MPRGDQVAHTGTQAHRHIDTDTQAHRSSASQSLRLPCGTVRAIPRTRYNFLGRLGVFVNPSARCAGTHCARIHLCACQHRVPGLFLERRKSCRPAAFSSALNALDGLHVPVLLFMKPLFPSNVGPVSPHPSITNHKVIHICLPRGLPNLNGLTGAAANGIRPRAQSRLRRGSV